MWLFDEFFTWIVVEQLQFCTFAFEYNYHRDHFRKICFPAFNFLIFKINAPKNTPPVIDCALKLILLRNFVYTHNVCSYTNNKLCLSEFFLVFGVCCCLLGIIMTCHCVLINNYHFFVSVIFRWFVKIVFQRVIVNIVVPTIEFLFFSLWGLM